MLNVLGKLFNVGAGAGSIVDAVAKGIDAVHTSKEEKLQARTDWEEVKQKPALMQVLVNLKEAQHRTVFVAGWRPFIGWVGGFALVWHFIIFPTVNWIGFAFNPTGWVSPPQLDVGDLIAIVMAMLGMGYMRTKEKESGIAS